MTKEHMAAVYAVVGQWLQRELQLDSQSSEYFQAVHTIALYLAAAAAVGLRTTAHAEGAREAGEGE